MTSSGDLHEHGPDTDSGAPPERGRMNRRRFLGAGAAAGASLAAVVGPYSLANGQTVAEREGSPAALAQATTTAQGFEYFTTFQADIVNAAAGRIIPADDNGPGAIEAGVVYFIDRQLSSLEGFAGQRYNQGPFLQGTPTQGDQSSMSIPDRWRLGILGMEAYAQETFHNGFALLTTDQQDQVLKDMDAGKPATFDGASIQAVTTSPAQGGTETGLRHPSAANLAMGAKGFFDMLRAAVVAGFFADPVHGGNRDMVGWKLIGFPGAQMSYASDILNYGQPWQGGYKSLAEYQGQYSVHPNP